MLYGVRRFRAEVLYQNVPLCSSGSFHIWIQTSTEVSFQGVGIGKGTCEVLWEGSGRSHQPCLIQVASGKSTNISQWEFDTHVGEPRFFKKKSRRSLYIAQLWLKIVSLEKNRLIMFSSAYYYKGLDIKYIPLFFKDFSLLLRLNLIQSFSCSVKVLEKSRKTGESSWIYYWVRTL